MTLHVGLVRYSKCSPQQLSRRSEHTASHTQSRTLARISPAEKLFTFAFNFLKDFSMLCGILVFITLSDDVLYEICLLEVFSNGGVVKI